jgi:hypothetical protein
MSNLAGMVFLMLLPIFFGAMAVFLVQWFQSFIINLIDLFDNSNMDEMYR